jgi:hypothetical protein
MNETDAGRQIDVSLRQSAKAVVSIRVSFEPNSKMTAVSDLHVAKHFRGRDSTAAGIRNVRRAPHPENASLPITLSRDPGSIVTSTSAWHSEKHRDLRTVTDAGIRIEKSLDAPAKWSSSLSREPNGASNVTDTTREYRSPGPGMVSSAAGMQIDLMVAKTKGMAIDTAIEFASNAMAASTSMASGGESRTAPLGTRKNRIERQTRVRAILIGRTPYQRHSVSW